MWKTILQVTEAALGKKAVKRKKWEYKTSSFNERVKVLERVNKRAFLRYKKE